MTHPAAARHADARAATTVDRARGFVRTRERVAPESEDRRWRASVGFRLEAFVLTPEGVGSPLDHLGAHLLEWLASQDGPHGVQLHLGANPATQAIHVALRIDVDGPDAISTAGLAERRAQDAAQLLRGFAGARFAPELPLADVAHTCGRVARPALYNLGGVAVPEPWDPASGDSLRHLALALLREPHRSALVISLQPVHDPRPFHLLHTRCSALAADVAARIEGARFSAADGRTTIQRFPEDLVALEASRAALLSQLAWLAGLRRLAVRCQVAVIGDAEPSAPILYAVQRTCLGVHRIGWTAIGADQARDIGDGALSALETPVAGDTDALALPALSAVPAEVAARLLRPPSAGPDGLPGVPVEAGAARPLPNAMLRPSTGFLLGLGSAPDGPAAVRIGAADLARHVYLCGKTGVGKTTVLATLIRDLALRGEGVGLIDPHGDLADALVEAISPRRPVVVFDPMDPNCPGLDPIWHDGDARSIERSIEDLTAILFRLFPAEYMGPMFDRHSRALLLPLMIARLGLAEMSRFASDGAFRSRCLRALDPADPLHADVSRFWVDEYGSWDQAMRGEMQSYTVSKYDTLVKSSALRRITDPGRPQLDIRAVIDSGGVLIARLPQGTLGPVSAYFLGMLLLSRLQAAVFSRSTVRASERRPFTLVLDEFQNFLGGGGYGYASSERTLGPLLSEARKFGLRLVLANQYIAQLDETTRDAIFGNVGSLVSFRVGARDSELLAEELGGGVTARELRELPLYQGLARMLRDGQPAPVFSLRTIRP